MQVALGLQYIQDRAAFHGTFHDAACADGIADGINISMGISECFLKLRQNRVIGAHSKTVESVIEGEILDGSVRKLYSECVFFYFLKSSVDIFFYTVFVVCLTHGAFGDRVCKHTDLRQHIDDGTLGASRCKVFNNVKSYGTAADYNDFLALTGFFRIFSGVYIVDHTKDGIYVSGIDVLFQAFDRRNKRNGTGGVYNDVRFELFDLIHRSFGVEENIMPNITGHTELVGLMAYPIRHTQSPTTHNLAYDKNGDDVIQLAFEVDNDSLKDAVQSIRALKMLGSNISMPNKTVVHKYLDEVDEAAKLCGAINTVVNLRDENGQVTGKLKGYNTDGMGYWQALTEEGIDFKGMKMVLIGTGGAATAIAVRGALDGVAEIEIFNIKDKFYSRGEEIVDLINKNTNCKATMNDLADKDLLKEKMHAADLFCDATGVGMHPLEDLSNIPDPSFFKKDLIVTDTVYAPRETVMMKQAKEAGCEKVFNGMGMMLFQALIAIKLYTGKDTPVDYMKEKLGI